MASIKNCFKKNVTYTRPLVKEKISIESCDQILCEIVSKGSVGRLSLSRYINLPLQQQGLDEPIFTSLLGTTKVLFSDQEDALSFNAGELNTKHGVVACNCHLSKGNEQLPLCSNSKFLILIILYPAYIKNFENLT